MNQRICPESLTTFINCSNLFLHTHTHTYISSSKKGGEEKKKEGKEDKVRRYKLPTLGDISNPRDRPFSSRHVASRLPTLCIHFFFFFAFSFGQYLFSLPHLLIHLSSSGFWTLSTISPPQNVGCLSFLPYVFFIFFLGSASGSWYLFVSHQATTWVIFQTLNATFIPWATWHPNSPPYSFIKKKNSR